MIKPNTHYYQTSATYKYAKYGDSTIGRAGCGPTTAANVVKSLKGTNVTPKTACDFAYSHGYKVVGGGTSMSFFKPYFQKHGIKHTMLDYSYCYHNTKHTNHAKMLSELKKNNWVICVMGPGNWTKGGHYILVYGYKDGYVYICDPASSKESRSKAKLSTWQYQVKYYACVVETVENNYYPKCIVNEECKDTKAVKWVQKKVRVTQDGIYGKKTKEAVKKYQKSHGLTVDGIAGPKTIAKMK